MVSCKKFAIHDHRRRLHCSGPKHRLPPPSLKTRAPPQARRRQRQQELQGRDPRRGDPTTHRRKGSEQPPRKDPSGLTHPVEVQNPLCRAGNADNKRKEEDPPRHAAVSGSQREENWPTRRKRRRAFIRMRMEAPAPSLRQTLDVDTNLYSLYTSEPRFPGHPPSSALSWRPERKRAGEITAGKRFRTAIALPPPLDCSKGKDEGALLAIF